MGLFSVRRDNKYKTQSRTIAEKHTTQSPPLTPGCRTLSRFFMSQVDVSCSIFVFPTSRTTLEKSTSERSWFDKGRVVWGLLSQSFIICSTVWASLRICKQLPLIIIKYKELHYFQAWRSPWDGVRNRMGKCERGTKDRAVKKIWTVRTKCRVIKFSSDRVADKKASSWERRKLHWREDEDEGAFDLPPLLQYQGYPLEDRPPSQGWDLKGRKKCLLSKSLDWYAPFILYSVPILCMVKNTLWRPDFFW